MFVDVFNGGDHLLEHAENLPLAQWLHLLTEVLGQRTAERDDELKGHKTQLGDFYGKFSRRKNSPQQLLSCNYINKDCVVNRTSVTHIDTI